MTNELTPEERKQMHESQSWSCAPEPGERSQVGDAVPCPRCHRGAVMHNSKKPCVSCQLKAADARIAELEKEIVRAVCLFKNCMVSERAPDGKTFDSWLTLGKEIGAFCARHDGEK